MMYVLMAIVLIQFVVIVLLSRRLIFINGALRLISQSLLNFDAETVRAVGQLKTSLETINKRLETINKRNDAPSEGKQILHG